MQKIAREDIESHPEFLFAKTFLKDNVTRIASKYASNEPDINKRANNHFFMVAEVAKLYFSVIEMFTEKDLKDLHGKAGNVKTLNKFLAVRQLAETQLRGVMEGTWGLPTTVTETEDFKTAIAHAACDLSRTQFFSSVKETV